MTSNPRSHCLWFFTLLLSAVLPAHADRYPINRNVDVQHYRFELRFYETTDRLEGNTTVTVRVKTKDLHSFTLDLIRASANGRGMLVEKAWMNEQPIRFRHDSSRLTLFIDTPVAANTLVNFRIQYRGIPADALRIGKDKFGERGYFSDNWPNKTRHWLPTVDHPYDKASCEFLLTVPVPYTAVSNGLLTEQSLINDTTAYFHWMQTAPIATWLYTIGISKFAMTVTDHFMGKPIQSWVYARDREAGFADFAQPTKEVLQFMSEEVGPFAYEKIANIESPAAGGGMEAASAISYNEKLIDGKKNTRIRNVIIHELAHQWFSCALTETTWDDVWLSESFATYYTLQFIQHAYGDSVYREELAKARKLFLDYLKNEPPMPLVSPRDPDDAPVTQYAVTYQKGAWVLTMLHGLIGDKAFRAGIRAYYRAHYNSNATTSDFIKAMERSSHRNLKTFFDQWLYRTDLIRAGFTWRYEESKQLLHLSVYQEGSKNDAYTFPLVVHLTVGGKPVRRVVQVSKSVSHFQLRVNQKPERVSMDPEGKLLAAFYEKKPL